MPLLAAGALLVSGCDDEARTAQEPAEEAGPTGPEDGTADPDDGPPEDVPDAELAEFCRLQVEMDQRAGPDWIGSDEHVAHLDELAELAPAEIRTEVTLIRDHIDAEVSPDDPESRDISTYPSEVRDAIEAADAHAVEVCGFTMPEDA